MRALTPSVWRIGHSRFLIRCVSPSWKCFDLGVSDELDDIGNEFLWFLSELSKHKYWSNKSHRARLRNSQMSAIAIEYHPWDKCEMSRSAGRVDLLSQEEPTSGKPSPEVTWSLLDFLCSLMLCGPKVIVWNHGSELRNLWTDPSGFRDRITAMVSRIISLKDCLCSEWKHGSCWFHENESHSSRH
jgi:hypothetical protein